MESTKKSPSTDDLIAVMACAADVPKQKAKVMLRALQEHMIESVGPAGSGGFTIPGLLKVEAVKMPGRRSITRTSPFNGKPMVIPERPPYVKLRVRPLKRLKDAAN